MSTAAQVLRPIEMLSIHFKDGMLELSVCGATEADRIICEFMVAANTCMAYYFAENNLPGIYRVQRDISLNAGYSTEQQNHESLAICGGYMRFISPIRRAADYRIHQVLTAFLDGESAESIKSKYLEKMTAYCTEAQALEDRARQLEHKILNECHMLYFGRREDDTFRGVVIGASRDNEHSVIELQSYSIRVFGAFELAKYTGQVFMIKVSPDLERKCLLVRRIERTAVA